MLEDNSRILQLNIMKLRAGMEDLTNDHQSQKLDVLLIQVPSITAYRTHVNHSAWRLYQPTAESDSVWFRSLIYTLIFSVYIAPVPMHTPDGASAEATLSAIHHTIQNVARDDSREPSALFWPGTSIAITQRGVTTTLNLDWSRTPATWINFIHDYDLQSCLPRGIATFWSLSHPGRNCTIDLTVTNTPDLLIKRHLYHGNYGSDH
ncbi:Endonuclease/exonuclease/phosphatase [Penicillium camemberti]|uniref:Endonuclease/exonuclease/phosphatase n=1 Tax=Penicillium camemberti (strain FM 013) TaxID=1429867 RepID=A0A0G4PX06_PENC3|nr:Endonuclease/exonuclease/phosphatase [Penicillium camemberti]